MRTRLAVAIVFSALATAAHAQGPADPYPKTVEEFRSAVQAVLSDTGVPGAGLALVRSSGVEWAGGVGLADREARLPVTADTHFRAGSISKTFIAIALVQMYLDGTIDLDAPVAELASEISIDNAWEHTNPVRVIHLLQHTAGFDDMHFNETYADPQAPERSLEEVLAINPASRVVRWRPGTRMSYSNPGYTVAAHLIEKITGQKYEDRIAERIFKPAGMTTSSFRLTKDDEKRLAKGYGDRSGPAVPYSPIYLRPSGNLHTSSLELGRFVQLLLNWGETDTDLVIDPEYLSNMEHPRTTLASDAGLRNGYGSGISSSAIEGFPWLGHNGGIDGFSSMYAYSTSRDVGFVVLLNSTHSPEAMRRIARLAVRYLKADVAPPEPPRVSVPSSVLQQYEGYYHDANPRQQAVAFVQWLLSGRTVRVESDHLVLIPIFGAPTTLIPVTDTMFRRPEEPEATRVFVTANGETVLTGGDMYAEKLPRWRVESIRWPVLVSSAIVLTPILMLVPWLLLKRSGPDFLLLKVLLISCALAFALPVLGIYNVDDYTIGTLNIWTTAMFAGTILMPASAVLSFLLSIDAARNNVRPSLKVYAFVVSIAALIISGYLSAWGMIGFKPWSS